MKSKKAAKPVVEEAQHSKFHVLFEKYSTPEKPIKKGAKPVVKVPLEILKQLIVGDPTTKLAEGFNIEEARPEEMENIHIGKFINWLIRCYLKPEIKVDYEVKPESREYERLHLEAQRLFIEDLYKTTGDLKKYERAKPYLAEDKRDINKYNPDTLFDMLSGFQIPEKKAAEIEKKEVKKSRDGFNHKGSDVAYVGDNWTVIKISDTGTAGRDAAVYFGGFHEYDMGESRWCTSSPGLTYYNGYIKDGPLYVIFPNDDKGKVGKKTGLPVERYQWHFPSNQFMDRDDRNVQLVDWLKEGGKMSELREYFKPEFASGLVEKASNKLSITYPNQASGKYIALYGFDDLFNTVPDDLKAISIENTSKDDVCLDVPASIKRFKSLNSLLMRNVLKSLPKEMGELKALRFLSIADNPKLKSIPKELADLPKLEFITVRGTDIVKVPKEISDKFSNKEAGMWILKGEIQ